MKNKSRKTKSNIVIKIILLLVIIVSVINITSAQVKLSKRRAQLAEYEEQAEQLRLSNDELAKLLEDNLDKNSESGSQSNSGIQVYIGEENGMQDMKDCSVVTARYDLGDGVQGTLGVVGPKRMDYEKVVGTLKNLRDQLDAIYKKNEP